MTNYKHGHARLGAPTRTYRTWNTMMDRCLNPNSTNWEKYGGRGISVCDRWRTFSNFLEDMGERPPRMSIHRIDNDGDYEPDNCEWTTTTHQTFNRRKGA